MLVQAHLLNCYRGLLIKWQTGRPPRRQMPCRCRPTRMCAPIRTFLRTTALHFLDGRKDSCRLVVGNGARMFLVLGVMKIHDYQSRFYSTPECVLVAGTCTESISPAAQAIPPQLSMFAVDARGAAPWIAAILRAAQGARLHTLTAALRWARPPTLPAVHRHVIGV